MIDELERTWKEAVVTRSRFSPETCLGGTEEIPENPVRTVGVPAKIRRSTPA
jgi:hypothetical protein